MKTLNSFLLESILNEVQLNESILSGAQLTESIFSIPTATKDDLHGLISADALCDLLHIEHDFDKFHTTMTKSGSYYDITMDISNSNEIPKKGIFGQYRKVITINIERSKKSGIDFKHTRVKLKTNNGNGDGGIAVVLKSNGIEINTNNFFADFETDDDIVIQASSLGKDITIKTSESWGSIIFDPQKRTGLYIKAKIVCAGLYIINMSSNVVDMEDMKKTSRMRGININIDVSNSGGQSLINRIITRDPSTFNMHADTQIHPEIFDILKLPDISLIRKGYYNFSVTASQFNEYVFFICKKGVKITGWPKVEQNDPTINVKWDVYA